MIFLNSSGVAAGIACVALCVAQTTVSVQYAPIDLVQARLKRGNVKGTERQDTVRAIFNEAGCAAEEQRVGRKSANVICQLPGTSEATIIAGAHFDFVDKGRGLVDDWSGTALLPSLYEALKTEKRKHTFEFVAFADEETGLNGSARFVRELKKEQRAHVSAFVNLEFWVWEKRKCGQGARRRRC